MYFLETLSSFGLNIFQQFNSETVYRIRVTVIFKIYARLLHISYNKIAYFKVEGKYF